MKLTAEQIDRLGDLMDIDGIQDAFVESTERLLSRNVQPSTREPRKVVRDDVKRIRKAIDKASDTTLGILSLRGYPLDELKAHLDTFEIAKQPTHRMCIGAEAWAAMYNSNIRSYNYMHIGTSETGTFANYLNFLFEILELDYNPKETARDVIAWWEKENKGM